MKSYRLNRLFNSRSGNCFDVALDHGFFGEPSFLSDIENIESAVHALIEAAPDAIQLIIGQAHWLQSRPGKNKPALILRLDVANVYGRNVIQHPNPRGITRALMALVHDNASPETAAELIEETA